MASRVSKRRLEAPEVVGGLSACSSAGEAPAKRQRRGSCTHLAAGSSLEEPAAAPSGPAAGSGRKPRRPPRPGGRRAPAAWEPSEADREADRQRGLALLEAHSIFDTARGERRLFLEVDVAAALDPHALVGRDLRVLWPDDAAWYLGRATAYDANTGIHSVDYADGDHGEEVLALERVRLLVHAGEVLPPPSPETLERQAGLLLEKAAAGARGRSPAVLHTKAQQLLDLAEKRRVEQRSSQRAQQDMRRPEQQQQQAASEGERTQASDADQPSQQQLGVQESSCDLQQEGEQLGEQARVQQGECSPGGTLQPQQSLLAPSDQQQQQQAGHSVVAAAASAGLGGWRLGDVVWARSSGFRDWPSLVISREEAIDRGAPSGPARSPQNIPLLYFGTAEVGCLRPGALTGFEEGLARGFHGSQRKRKEQAFRRALCEVEAFLRAGELPQAMLPDHNDGVGAGSDDDDDEEEAAGSKGRGRGAKGAKKGRGVEAPGGVVLPFKANKHVTVLSLGRINWIHPAFHDEKHLWAVGYTAERLAATPASGGREVPHRCEVLEHPDGSGPLFRVTPKGGQSVEGATPTLAWQALYAEDQHGRLRSMGIWGPTMFGLTSPKVQALLHRLPDAKRCERYCGWPEGEEPTEEEAPPLSATEHRARLACTARMQQLQAEVRPVPLAAPWATAAQQQQHRQGQQAGYAAQRRQFGAVCEICMHEEEEGDDAIIQCDSCRAFVHMSCYGVERNPFGGPWLCDVCELGLERPPACALCPVMGGVMKPTACGRWCHSACGLWTEETRLDAERGVITGVQEVRGARLRLSCQVCRQQYGSCVQCAGSRKCYAAFHPLCAWGAGYHMQLVEDSDSDSDSEAGDSGDENDPGAPNHQQQSGKRARRGKRKEGTGLGRGMRLVAHCPRHPPAPRSPERARPSASLPAGGEGDAGPVGSSGLCREGSQGRLALLPLGSRLASSRAGSSAALAPQAPPAQQAQQPRRGSALAPEGEACRDTPAVLPALAALLGSSAIPTPAQQAQRQAAAGAAQQGTAQTQQEQQQPFLNPHGCARAAPFNHAARRGQRAPEALAAAEAKRLFVESLPYTVGGPLQQDAKRVPPSFLHPYPAAERPAPAQAQAPAQPPPPAALPGPPGQQGPAATAGQAPAEQAGPRLTPSGERILSQAERFAEMRRSVAQRIAVGKSGIHGWGAFAKRRHRAGDMVVEYAGEVVRHSVSDVRERRLYNALLGAGTYTFTLNEHLNVDATRSGNLAHLLNHSCGANCFSRTLSLRGPEGRVEDHVVIFALRDIEEGEELTYDYRFSGKELLPCNCGASSCRGLVNMPRAKREGLWVPRHKLKPFMPPGSQAGRSK